MQVAPAMVGSIISEFSMVLALSVLMKTFDCEYQMSWTESNSVIISLFIFDVWLSLLLLMAIERAERQAP